MLLQTDKNEYKINPYMYLSMFFHLSVVWAGAGVRAGTPRLHPHHKLLVIGH